MAEIPSFFNKVDFFGVLLPGYLTVTLYIILFRPELLFGTSTSLSADLFTAVVFVVFGPAVGLALQQFHRRLYVIIDWVKARLPGSEVDEDFPAKYAYVRLTASDSEKLELDSEEAEYDFSVSTGLAFLMLGVYDLAVHGTSNLFIPVALTGLSAVFLVGGYMERSDAYTPLVDGLIDRHHK